MAVIEYWSLSILAFLLKTGFVALIADMLTSDDRKKVDLHLQRGSIARGVFRDILELENFKICHNSMIYWGGGGCLNWHARALKTIPKINLQNFWYFNNISYFNFDLFAQFCLKLLI